MLKENKEIIKRLVGSVIVIALIVGVLYLLFYFLGWTNLTKEQLQDYIKSTGIIAPLVYVVITFAQVTLVPIPGAVTILAGSYLFGFLGAFIYSYIGMMLGSVVSFALGRVIGKPYVNWVTGGADKTEQWLKKLEGRENVFLFFAFFLPFFPDDILCAVAGALPIKWRTFIIMQLITRFTSILGTMLFMSGEIIPFHGWGLLVLALVGIVLLLIFIFSVKYSKQVNDYFSNFIDNIVKKKAKKDK
jgi:uncharacterized membrane protein YdjX (TVP38/TMEM64 family)